MATRMNVLPTIQQPRACCILLIHLLLLIGARAACYLPNGDDAVNYDPSYGAYQPCNHHAKVSMCCKTNMTNPSDRDHCESNGLCTAADQASLWRNMCTDKTWQSPDCIKLCVNGSALDPFGHVMSGVSHGITLTTCADGSYCCGVNATSCCDSGRGVWIDKNGEETRVNPNKTASSPSTISSSSSSTSTSSTSATSIATASIDSITTPTLSPFPSPSKSNDTGAIIGGVIGGVAGLMLLAAALFWLLRRRKSNEVPAPPPYDEQHNGTATSPIAKFELDPVMRSELSSGYRPHEADSAPRSELAGAGQPV